ncbi:O-antigen ligase family protein [Pseudooceanicola marinus]|uniref:O-antigen ligase family protein n=1 Tax=Pseudooceanicola marinus TaxID=396013 RepID=UPI001CD48D63|nr:O-antigen ligase family protein [Pseudooceanicola marinus]MCA1338159.1 O-antigen ligase family protein [Pseudooceanicola marinus]
MKITVNMLAMGLLFLTAPMGKALLPGFPLGDFVRFFFLLLPLTLLYLLRYRSAMRLVIWLVLYFLVGLVSIVLNLDSLPANVSPVRHPVMRLIVHNMIVWSFVLAAWRCLELGTDKTWDMVILAFKGYLAVTVLGCVLYFGVTSHVFPRSFYEQFNVLTQDGYGLLRFNPGSYPNEFGTMSAFFCTAALALIIRGNRRMSLPLLVAIAGLGFMAMALATTRAAYLSFAVSVIFALWSVNAGKTVRYIGILTVVVIAVVIILPDDTVSKSLNVLQTGYRSAVAGSASVGVRYTAWGTAYEQFSESSLLGLGFEFPTVSGLHNTYLQFFFGLGVLGFSLCIGVFLAVSVLFRRRFLSKQAQNWIDSDLQTVAVIAAINACMFALSNHNQNHFLTWFAIFLFFVTGSLCPRRAVEGVRRRTRTTASPDAGGAPGGPALHPAE